MSTRTAVNVIPDDRESSTYRFIIVAAKRARQLQSGARSFLPSTSKSLPSQRWKKFAAVSFSTRTRFGTPA